MRRPLAAAGERGALLDAARDVALDALALRRRHQRADDDAGLARVADLERRRRAAASCGGELVVDRLLDQQRACRRCRSGRCGRSTPAWRWRSAFVAVGVGEDDVRRLAAQLEQRALHARARRSPGCAARPAVLPVNEIMSTSGDSTSASPISGAEPQTKLTTPGGSTDVDDAAQLGDAERIDRRRLDDHGVAAGERRADLAGAVGHREVEGRDAGDDADRARARRCRTAMPRPGRSSRGGSGSSAAAPPARRTCASRMATAPTCCDSATGRSAPVSAMVRSTRPRHLALNRAAALRSSAPRSAPLMRGHGPLLERLARRARRRAHLLDRRLRRMPRRPPRWRG